MTTQLVKFKDFVHYTTEINQFVHLFNKHYKSYIENKEQSWEVNFSMLDGLIRESNREVKITETKYWDKPWQYSAPAHIYQFKYVRICVYVNHNNLLEIGDYFEIIINK